MSFPTSDSIEKRINYLKKLVKRKQRNLSDTPEGLLRVKTRGERYYYEHLMSDGSLRYLRLQCEEDMALARALAQSNYDKKVIQSALDEIKILSRVKRFYKKGCAEDIYEKMNPARRALIAPVRLTDDEYATRWQVQLYKRKERAGQSPAYKTERGEYVRSKSEVIIANALYARGIPYRYERPVQLTNHLTGEVYTAHPDFEVLDVKNRQSYLWEHLGRMDDPDYATDSLGRLIDYENAGYFLGERLLVTYETRQDPLTPERVIRIICKYLS